jgi:hypothetical protein
MSAINLLNKCQINRCSDSIFILKDFHVRKKPNFPKDLEICAIGDSLFSKHIIQCIWIIEDYKDLEKYFNKPKDFRIGFCSVKVLLDIENNSEFLLKEKLLKLNNIFFFHNIPISLRKLRSGDFDILPNKNKLFKYEDSITNVINFLAGSLNYKNIYYNDIKNDKNKEGVLSIKNFYPNSKIEPYKF